MGFGKRKLILGEKVEVRGNQENGFADSWRSATVVDDDHLQKRLIKYDHHQSLLLPESIQVPSTIEGFVPSSINGTGVSSANHRHRGLIRPLPPCFSTSHPRGFPLGTCVDARFNDAWWEGVILDYQDGSSERLVFFPDVEEEQVFNIDHLRMTYDWDEVADNWSVRGIWVLPDLIQEHQHHHLGRGTTASASGMMNSVKSVWSSLRQKEAFKTNVKHWTCWRGGDLGRMWDDLVGEVIRAALTSSQQQTPRPAATGLKRKAADETSDDFRNAKTRKTHTSKFKSLVKDILNESHSPIHESSVTAGSVLVVQPEYCPEALVRLIECNSRAKNLKNLRSKASKHLSVMGWKFWYAAKQGRCELRYTSPNNKTYYSLRTACKGCLDDHGPATALCAAAQNPSSQYQKSQTKAQGRTRAESSDTSHSSCVLQSHRRTRPVEASTSASFTRTILSWLIQQDAVLPRTKVYCINRHTSVTTQGRITQNGIKCNCCQKVYGVSGFVAHAGKIYCKPAAHVYLEDGRSLLDIQKEIYNSTHNSTSEPHPSTKNKFDNDCICSVCHYGGTILLCDHCPSAFHLQCIGLNEVPAGDWFCPSCRCGICGNTDNSTEKPELCCTQCERNFHVECITKRSTVKHNFYPNENWFCSKECEKVFTGLHELLGRPIAAGVDNLTWTLVKFTDTGQDTETLVEYHSKLNVALGLMHDCFHPIKEPHTDDIVRDVLFNRRSPLKRLDFGGFYTVVLEKGDEIISVATVRVFGGNVAEVPLVGTSVKYRRQGMCRSLMGMLETKLAELGVQRLLLPAIPQVKRTWVTSFHFSEMDDLERREFLQYTFLDFQGTSMCHKSLKRV